MEAAAAKAGSPPRDLAGDKAARIVDAMRASVAVRGAAGSTFDHVAREAGVSRGLLHYYFGTKERMLVEVVRRDCDIRMERLAAALDKAATADDFVDVLVHSLEDMVEHEAGFITLIFELFVLSRRNEDIAVEMAELFRRTRDQVAGVLEAKAREGVLELHAPAAAVTEILFSMADGLALRMLAAPDQDFSDALRAGTECARGLLTDSK